MLVSKQVLLIGLEETPGKKATITKSDAVLVNSVSLSNANARMVERSVIKKSLASLQQLFAGTLQQVQFTCEVKGSGDDTGATPPEIGDALLACGFVDAGLTGAVGYKTGSGTTAAPLKTATIELYQDGVFRRLVGCVGTVSFTINAGEVITADFTFTGKYDDHAAGTEPTGVEYNNTVPTPLIGLSGFQIGGKAAPIGAMTIDVGNTITTPADITDAHGYGLPIISARDVTGTLDPELSALAQGDPDYLQNWIDGTVLEITTGDIGKDGNMINFTMSKAAFRDVQQGERDGIITESLTFGAFADKVENDGELTITFS